MKKPTILCIDDEKIVLVSLKEQLKRIFEEDYYIETVDNGELSLEIVKELVNEDVDIPLVIADQVMVGMKGDELLAHIHTISPRTLTVMLTGQASAEAVGNALNKGRLYRYLSKPWEVEDLTLTAKEAVHSYFQSKTLEKQNTELQAIREELEATNKMLKRKIEVFNKFVPAEFLKLLTLEKDYIELGQCAERTLSVMFADVHSFTLIAESLPLTEIFEFINRFLHDISPFIKKYNGFIDKFVGDAVMALFSNPDDAVRAAIEIQQCIITKRHQDDLLPYQVGISVHTGPVMIGTVGVKHHMETTAIGDTVNVASHIENLTKVYKSPLLITQATANSLREPSHFCLRNIDMATVKGRQEPLELFEVLDAFPEALKKKKLAILDLFQQARTYYAEHHRLMAKKLFTQCLEICPEDQISRIYLSRIEG